MGGLAIAIAIFLVLLVILIAYSAMSAPAAPSAAAPAPVAPKSAAPITVAVPLVTPVASVPVYQPTSSSPSFSTPPPATSAPVAAPAPVPAPAPATVATVTPNVAPVITPATAPIAVAPAPPAPLPAKVPGAITAGCRDCGSGLYFCDKGIISSSEWWNGQAAQVSDYRMPLYDPSTPNTTIGGDGYYWRQGADGCPNDPKPGAIQAGCTKCSSSGMYFCPKGKITSTEWWNGAAALVSKDRMPEYDPINPNVSLGDSKYYWRMAADSCGKY